VGRTGGGWMITGVTGRVTGETAMFGAFGTVGMMMG
jgi:hypothetical protein